MSASIVVAVSFLSSSQISEAVFNNAYLFPLVVAGGGLLGCVVGIVIVTFKKMGNNPSKELNLATYISAAIALIIFGIFSYIAFGKMSNADLESIGFVIGWFSPWVCAILGIISGVAIGAITEYFTSFEFKPTKEIAEYATEGEAFVVTKGDAVGSKSCLFPILIIGASLLIAGSFQFHSSRNL